MKVVHLQISRVISTDSENLPVFETYPIKLIEDHGDFAKFIENISVMGYVKKQTKVLKVVDIDDKTKKESELDDISSYEAQLDAAFSKKVEEKIDYKAELEKERAEKEKLLKRLDALEARVMSDELSVLQDSYKQKYGKNPDKRWGIEKLKEEIDSK